MKIAYWSNLRKEQRISSHIAAISVMLAMNYSKRVITMNNYCGPSPLEQAFRGIQRFYYVKEDSEYSVHRNGMDYILPNLYHEVEQAFLLSKNALEVIQDRLYYLPSSRVINNLAYEYQLNHEISFVTKELERQGDIIFIDTMRQNNLSTKTILQEADLVIVELNQQPYILEEFFENYSSLRSKAIFLFNHYHSKAIPIRAIMDYYHLPKEKVIVLTEHFELEQAYLEGMLVGFLKRNHKCTKESKHYRCIRELKRAAYLIVQTSKEAGTQSEKTDTSFHQAVSHRCYS